MVQPVKKIKKGSAEYNENIKRQQELIAAGYKGVEANGSWGPWQLKLYDKYKKEKLDKVGFVINQNLPKLSQNQTTLGKAIDEVGEVKWEGNRHNRKPVGRTYSSSNVGKTLLEIDKQETTLNNLKEKIEIAPGVFVNRYETKLKYYDPGIFGLLHHLWDAATNNDTYTVDNLNHDLLVNLGGSVEDLREAPIDFSQKNNDYWNWWKGANDRWKSSMNNETHPFVGLNRTVVPALTLSTAAYYAPQVASTVATKVPILGRAVVQHPQLMSKVAASGLKTFGKSMLGGEAVNLTSKVLTGNNWGENVSQVTGMPETMADFTNPGYAAGAFSWRNGIKNLHLNEVGPWGAWRRRLAAKQNIAENEALISELEKDTDVRRAVAKDLQDLYYKASDESSQLRNSIYGLHNDIRNLEFLSKPIDPASRKAHYDSKRKIDQWLRSDELDTDVLQFNKSYTDFPIKSDTEIPGVEIPITFTHPSGQTTTSTVKIMSKPVGQSSVDGHVLFNVNPDGTVSIIPNKSTVNLTETSRFGNIFELTDTETNRAIGLYVDELNSIMGEDGIVAGSSVHHKNGIFPATLTNDGSIIGPADTEIYTTRDRLSNLTSKLGFIHNETNSIGGLKGTSKFTFRNNNNGHSGVDTEINIIELDNNGNAVGTLAHLIYRALYPEQYGKLIYDHAMSSSQIPTSLLPLPVSAEQLLLTLKSNPDNILLHLLTDLIGMETFTFNKRFLNLKASKRIFSTLFNENSKVTDLFNRALKTHGTYNMGSEFKLGSELFPNLSFNDVATNKEFLKQVYKLSEEEANRFALNPEVMRNAFNYYNYSYSTGTRMVGSDVIINTTTNGEKLHDPIIEMFTGNGAFNGGNWSGNGLNRTLLNPLGGWSVGKADRGGYPFNRIAVTQNRLTFYPEKIKTPMDLYNLVERLKSLPADDARYSAAHLATFSNDPSKPIIYDKARINQIELLAQAEDVPVNIQLGPQYGFGYSGSYSKPLAAGARVTSTNPDKPDAPELGSLFKDMYNSLNTSRSVNVPLEIEQDLVSYVPQIQSGLESVKKIWPTVSLKDRKDLLGNTATHSDGKLGFDGFTENILGEYPSKLSRKAFIGVWSSYRDNQSWALRRIKELLGQRRYLETKTYNPVTKAHDLSAIDALILDMRNEYIRALQDFVQAIQQYKSNKLGIYKLYLLKAKLKRKLKLTEKTREDLFKQRSAEELLISKNRFAIEDARFKGDRFYRNLYRANDYLNTSAKLGGIATAGLGLGTGIYVTSKNRQAKVELKAFEEQQGLKDPRNGNYFLSLIKKGYTVKQANDQVKIAFDKYIDNLKREGKNTDDIQWIPM